MSTPNYPSILSLRYPTLQWTMSANDYATLTILDASPKPTQTELDALWDGVETELSNRVEIEIKTNLVQASYSVQVQLIEAMRAISTGDKTVVNSILALWDNN